MASIKKYKKSKGYGWRVQYRSPDGTSRTKQGFRTKNEAQAWAEKNATIIREGAWVDPALLSVTVSELGVPWLRAQTHLKPSTLRTTTQVWNKHVEPTWGQVKIGSIKPSHVQNWLSQLDLSASMVRKCHACLAQILDVAVKDGTIPTNPARGVTLPRKPKPKQVYLTAQQLTDFAHHSKRPEIILLLGTAGLRWGEMAALRPCDLDPLRNRINISRNAVNVGGTVHIGTPKTHEERTVAVSKTVMGMLMKIAEEKAPGDLLWSDREGHPMRNVGHGSWFHEALKKVKADYRKRGEGFPTITPHDLRHVAAGLLIQGGANVKIVQRQLGHASAAHTLDIYAALWDDGLDEVAAVVDSALSECRGIVVG